MFSSALLIPSKRLAQGRGSGIGPVPVRDSGSGSFPGRALETEPADAQAPQGELQASDLFPALSEWQAERCAAQL